MVNDSALVDAGETDYRRRRRIIFFHTTSASLPELNLSHTTSASLPEAQLIAYYLREPPETTFAPLINHAEQAPKFFTGKTRTKIALVFFSSTYRFEKTQRF